MSYDFLHTFMVYTDAHLNIICCVSLNFHSERKKKWYKNCHWDSSLKKGSIRYHLGTIIGTNMYLLGTNMQSLGTKMYLLKGYYPSDSFCNFISAKCVIHKKEVRGRDLLFQIYINVIYIFYFVKRL